MRPNERHILVLGNQSYIRPFLPYGVVGNVKTDGIHRMQTFLDGDMFADTDLVVFTGGEDVHPSVYKEKSMHPSTYSFMRRDNREMSVFRSCRQRGIPMVGICRGAQFLTAMNGGSIVQDVTGHAIASHHSIMSTKTQGLHFVTSTHHQMMNPTGTNHEVLAVALGLSTKYELGSREVDIRELVAKNWGVNSVGRIKEPEVVWYPDTKSLAVQFHPERMDEKSSGYNFFHNLLEEYILPHAVKQ